jgi:predicted small lipoprotein YifL
MNDIYIFHIYILIIHYIMQLYNITGCGSRAGPAREPPSSRAEPGSSAREMAVPTRARSATELHRAELSSARFQP